MDLGCGQRLKAQAGAETGGFTQIQMNNKLANFICFMIATLALAAIFHDNISYIAHHRHDSNGAQIRLSHPVDQRLQGFSGTIEDGCAATIHEQHGSPLLPSGCPAEPR